MNGYMGNNSKVELHLGIFRNYMVSTSLRLPSDFSRETLQARRERQVILKFLKEKNCNLVCSAQEKHHLK